MKKLFVRIGPKTGPEKFFRCGFEFGRDYMQVEVDQATAGRLHAEQMLEVSEEQPEGFEAPADVTAQAAADAEAAAKAAEAAAAAALAEGKTPGKKK